MTDAPVPTTDLLYDSVGVTRPKALVFDWDNTLVDSWPAIHEALSCTFIEYGMVPWTLDEVKRRVRKSMRESFPPLFGDRWEEAGVFFKKAFTDIHLDWISPLPGAEQMLNFLVSDGLWLAVVSNKHGDVLRQEAAHLGWVKYFDRIIGAFDAERDKPAPDPVRMALVDSQIDSGPEVWFIGDTDIDIECGLNSGCTPVLVRSEPPRNGEFDEFRPALYLSDCLALSNMIRRL
jgi:phosphoglycolate phosphatase